jgi:hypothetical protein
MDNQNLTPNTVNPNPAERPAITPNVVMPGQAAEVMPGLTVPEIAQVAPEAAPVAPAGPSSVAPVGFAAPPAAPAPVPAVAPAAAATPSPVPGAPAAAGDVDVIEPEWVDKAEVVIAAHLNDPYGEEAAVEKLQQEYLKQRYGIKVADPNGEIKPSGS